MILLVSLIHNRKHLLPLCIQSALNQTLPRDKFIHLLFDNASSDGADKIAESVSKKYNHVGFFRADTNLGQQKAYNFILDNLADTATVMAVLDSDDELMPNALEEVYKFYNQHSDVGASYSGFNIIDSKSRLIVKNHPKARYFPDQFTESGQKKMRQLFVTKNGNFAGHLRAYSIDALRSIGKFNTNYEYATDYNVFGRMFENKYKVCKINSILYNFRQHGTQVQSQHSPQQTTDWLNMQKEFRDKWQKEGLI